MKNRMYRGRVMHRRVAVTNHHFSYPVYFYALDVDHLETLSEQVSGFGVNRKAAAAIHESDYLDGKDAPLGERVRFWLSHWPEAETPHRIVLVTSARYLNYVFNPVSFFLLYDDKDQLTGMLTEVNNTFGDRHLYCCPKLDVLPTGERVGRAKKAFHVSPFFDREGEYTFRIREEGNQLAIDVDLYRENKPALHATIEGVGMPLTTRTLWATLLRYPVTAALTMPRIMWQAARLRYQKKLPVYARPEPGDPMTIQQRPQSRLDIFCRKRVYSLLEKIEIGTLFLTDVDGSERVFRGHKAGPEIHVQIHHSRFYRRLIFDSDMGLAESFMAGEFEVDDLTGFIRCLIENRDAFDDGNQKTAILRGVADSFLHKLRQNTLINSRKNIRAHYDLSNEFFSTFLDPTMSYSCGVYNSPQDTLETAQRNKMHALIQKARITPDCHVLEIGTGWGSLAMEMARQTGCRVTTVTISSEQYALARKRVREAGLEEWVEVKLCDYRKIEGQYDRIVSVEMLEAVGHRYLPGYFAQCERLLKPDGLLVVQVITIPEARYDRYRKRSDFIRKHIFPGGHLPSLKAMSDAVADKTSMYVESVENIGSHYAPTLAAWQKTFRQEESAIRDMGFDDVFIRKWNYYFSYCEAAFVTGTLNVLHIVWSRSCNPTLLQDLERPLSGEEQNPYVESEEDRRLQPLK